MVRNAGGPSKPVAPVLVQVRALRPSLSPAEDRVADVVLADPRRAAALTISQLAEAARTSETTVLRFCKRLGLRGYPQLRLALAEAAASPSARPSRLGDIHAKDTVDEIVAKVTFMNASAVEETAQQLDRAALSTVASAMSRSGRVDIYGVGASAMVGADLQQKLHRIGVVSFCWQDPHIALTSAVLLGEGDVALGISHSGRTTETVECLSLAKERGALAVALTNYPTSPVGKVADVVLTTAARESRFRSGATASRIAALTVVDCLYMSTAQRILPSARRAMTDSLEAVRGHQLD